MPTGYTASVKDGKVKELGEFAWRCARSFGAFIMQRDDRSDAPLVMVDVPDMTQYHEDAIKAAKKRIKFLEGMDEEARETWVKEEIRSNLDRLSTQIDEYADAMANYGNMLKQVISMPLPEGEDHQGFWEFLGTQLTESIDFDCTPKYTLERIVDWMKLNSNPETYWQEQINQAHNDIQYHAKEIAEDIERTEGRNAWKAKLVDIIGAPSNGIVREMVDGKIVEKPYVAPRKKKTKKLKNHTRVYTSPAIAKTHGQNWRKKGWGVTRRGNKLFLKAPK